MKLAYVVVALVSNAVFSMMDLTSWFYSISICEEDKDIAFTMHVGLHEYIRMLDDGRRKHVT